MAEVQSQIPVAAVEPTDLGEGFIWGVVGLCLAGIVVCGLIVLWLYPQAGADRIITAALPEYPAPRLQVDSAADLRTFRAQQLQQLNSAGIAHIPIDQAMQQIAHEGIAGWPPP